MRISVRGPLCTPFVGIHCAEQLQARILRVGSLPNSFPVQLAQAQSIFHTLRVNQSVSESSLPLAPRLSFGVPCVQIRKYARHSIGRITPTRVAVAYPPHPEPPHFQQPPPPNESEEDPYDQQQTEWDTYNRPSILKPVLFAGSVVLISYSLATYIHAQRRWSLERRAFLTPQSLFESIFGPSPFFTPHPSYSIHPYRRNTWLDRNAPVLAEFFHDVQGVLASTKQSVIRSLKTATQAEKAVWGILGINILVWAAWRVPRFQPFMMRHFAHHPLSGRAHTMLTATFSHESLLHLW